MTFNEYTVDDLVDVLRRAGFVECDIAACNCGSWHHRYGLPERWAEIRETLTDAEVLNNETGNLPTRAVVKLVEQRDALAARLAEAERLLEWCDGHWRCHSYEGAPSVNFLAKIDAFLRATDSADEVRNG